MNTKEKGDLGEEIAKKYLVNIGASILETNYKLKFGEVDIIAKIDDEIVIVEVKSRTNINYGYPCESVNKKKMMKIIKVANYYVVKNSLENKNIRFDIIEVYLKGKKVNHIVDAFCGGYLC